MNFIESKTINKYLGLRYFKWIVKNTFFKYFNPGIKIRSRSTDLTEIRRQMTIAEIGHLIGFLFVLVFAIYWSIVHGLLFGLVIMMANVFMNLYPSLLQQENKRRIDKVINRLQIDKS
jgi:ABC-type bacteriocin/lantibiotic exporter with double-glycine peptidase domain